MVRMPRPISAHLRSSPLISAFARPGPLRRALALLEWQARTGPYLPRLGAHAAAGSISALRSARLLSSLLSPVTRHAQLQGPNGQTRSVRMPLMMVLQMMASQQSGEQEDALSAAMAAQMRQ